MRSNELSIYLKVLNIITMGDLHLRVSDWRKVSGFSFGYSFAPFGADIQGWLRGVR
jgi:hypothetical protein